MPYGPPVCACCGATENIEAHHLYSRKGAPDDLTVWLCPSCHGWTRQINVSELACIGLAAARARGVRLGGPVHGTPEHMDAIRPAGAAVRAARAAMNAERLRDVVRTLQAQGVTSKLGIAARLETAGYPAPRGGWRWHASQVQRLLDRLDNTPAPGRKL
jgi:hypothetical protein